jgi:hypothetical protein
MFELGKLLLKGERKNDCLIIYKLNLLYIYYISYLFLIYICLYSLTFLDY